MIDHKQDFAKIAENTAQLMSEHFPIQGQKHTLNITDVRIPQPKYSVDDEYEAKYNDKTLSTPVLAKVQLVDNESGKVIDEKNDFKLMKLPVYTKRGTFLIKGNEYSVGFQNRLRPGIYPVRKQTGAIESKINAAKGLPTGMGISFDPSKNKFQLKLDQSVKPLYPILHAAGIDDATLEKAWGMKIFLANKGDLQKKTNKNAILSTARKLTNKEYDNIEDASRALQEKFQEIILDKEINKRTVGSEEEVMSNKAWINTTRKLIRINQGLDEPIDRNSLHYKKFMWVDDFVPEKVGLHMKKKLAYKLKTKVDKHDKLDKIVSPGYLTKPVEQFFTSSALSEIADQYNPLDMVNSANKITPTGEGGINNMEVVTSDMRALHSTHAGLIDPIQTPESEKIGLNLYMATGAKKKGNRLVTNVFNPKTGHLEQINNAEMGDKVLALPDSKVFKKGKLTGKNIRVIKHGKITTVPREEVDYVIPMPQAAFSWAMNMVPFLNNNSGNRMFMAGRHMGQAISIKGNEKPLIQSGIGDTSFEKMIGGSSMSAPTNGVVDEVTDRFISILGDDGERRTVPVYKNFPLNKNHVLDTRAVHVKKGDKVTQGQSLGDTNFSKDGVLTLGTNLNVGYLADGGYNFEDGITISETAADKLTSEHLYATKFKTDENSWNDPKRFKAQFPNKLNAGQMKKLDKRGLVQEGTILEPGDPMILSMRKADDDPLNMSLKKLSSKLKRPWRDSSKYWDKEVPGEVIKVVQTPDGDSKVYVKTMERAKVADKLAGRYGNKGVITRILPDDRMPKNKEGDALEILLNPLGIPSRVNPGQMLETALAKVAKKTGEPIIIESFKDRDNGKWVKSQLKKHGFNPDGTEEIFDADGKSIGNILTGYQYMLKLAKQAKTNYSARAAGPGMKYDMNQQPSTGGDAGGKAMDLLSFYAMLSHGAKHNLREMATDKASNNPEFWRIVKSGGTLPAPKPTFSYSKFNAMLKGAGVNVRRRGSELQLMPFTDDHIMGISKGAVKNPQFMHAKTLRLINGGLLDKKIFGGVSGDRWGHIELAEPVLNPMFRAGAREITGMTDAALNELIKTKGGKGVQELLKKVNLEELETKVQDQLNKTTSPDKESEYNRRLHYIKALKDFKMTPVKAYTLTKVPVIPPNMRPITQQDTGAQTVSEPNWLYRDLMLTNSALKGAKRLKHIPERLLSPLRDELHRAVEAVAGVGDPVGYYAKGRKPRGFIEQIKGPKAKEGFFQKKVLRRAQDLTGRGVITPNPKFGVDEIGLPEDMAWNVFRPFVEGRLRKMGYRHHQVLDMLDKKDKTARKVLEKEMENRPVMLNRPPSLHKFSFLGFNPKIVPGKTIQIPSLVVKGFNADFDGDALMVHVPVRPEAVQEVKQKMMASGNIFNPRDGSPIVVPMKEANVGIYRASNTKAGRDELKKILPKEFHDQVSEGMTGGKVKKMLGEIGKSNPGEYKNIVFNLKRLGDRVAFNTGFTVTLDDLSLDDPRIAKIRRDTLDAYQRNLGKPEVSNKILAKYQERVQAVMDDHPENNFVHMMKSGGGGKGVQIKQIMATPIQYTDDVGRMIPTPVTGNFGEGMDMNDFFTSLFSARRGMIDKKMETSDPGAFAKQVLINTIHTTINGQDDLDDEGEVFHPRDKAALNRFIAADIKDKDGEVLAKKGDVMTPRLASRMLRSGVDKVNIHTVLSSNNSEGVSRKSYGLMSDGDMLNPGDNIGAIAGQAIAEPLQQGTMNKFHTAGAAGTQTLSGFDKVKRLLNLPQDIPGAGTLSEISGQVTKIERNPGGGTNVFVDDVKQFVDPNNKVIVKKGDKVDRGDPVSDGFIHPRHLVELTGDMDKTRRHLVDELMGALDDMGANVDRRNVEVLVKSLANTFKVRDPGDSDFIKGDVISYDAVKAHNAQKPTVKPVNEAEGEVLSEKTGGYRKGTLLTKEVMADLKERGVIKVNTKPKPITGKPALFGLSQLPRVGAGWMTQLASGDIKRELLKRAPAGDTSNLHGTDPIPGYAYGVEFGRNKEPGRY